MIWESVALMTAIDVVIITLVVGFTLYLHGRRITRVWGKRLVLMGVGLIAAFYAADLFTMWVLPSLSGEQAAMAAMRTLHLEWHWLASLAAIASITAGFLIIQRGVEAEADASNRMFERLRTLIEALPDGMLVLDNAGVVIEANTRAGVVFGTTVAGLVGMASTELFYELDAERGLSNGRLPALRLSGERFPAEISVTELAPAQSMILVRDVTEVAGLEAQLRQAQKMESLGRLAGGIAHDFNNYLTAVIGETELIDPGAPASAEGLKRIRESAERAAGLTNQLLAFSRKQTLDTKVVDLNRELTAMDGLLRHLIGKNITLMTVHDSQIAHVRVDAALFEQIVVNIAINASDAMPNGGKLTIETGNVLLNENSPANHPVVEPGEYVMVAITDTGVGMAKDVMEHIFEPFYTTKPRGRGTGLGLAMVMGFAQQSKGTVQVESKPNLGTTLRIYLPAVADELDPSVVRAPDDVVAELHGSETIVVAEDDDAVREFVEKALHRYGYRVSSCANAIDALEALQDDVGLLLTDIVMPNGSGFELAEQALAQYPNLPVLYMTGYVDQSLTARQNAPDAETLRKPFSVRELLTAVREGLSQA